MSRTKEDKIKLAQSFIDSKTTKRDFCREAGISAPTLTRYIALLEEEESIKNSGLQYVELPRADESTEVCSKKNSVESFTIEVNGVVLQIPTNVTPQFLGALMREVSCHV